MIADPDNSTRGVRTPLAKSIGEWLFALFLFAGYYKADPRLAFIQLHIDITLLFLLLSFLAFLHRRLREPFAKRMPSSFTRVTVLFLLLAASLIGGSLYTPVRGYGLDKMLRFIFLTGWAFFGAALLISDFLALRRFSWAIVIISTAMAIDGLLNRPAAGQIGFVTAFGSNYIALARASGLGLLAAIAFLWPTERRPLVKLCLWVIAALQLWAALSAGARGPVIALIFLFLLFFALSAWGFLRLRIDRSALRLGVLVFFFVALVLVRQDLFSTLLFRSQIALIGGDISLATRLSLYQAAIDLWEKSPIWGHGPGQFGVAMAGEYVRLYPHNIILELGAETGIIGVLIFVAMIGTAFTQGFISLRSGNRLAKTVARYLLAINSFALLNAMVSGDINDNRMLFTFVGLIATIPHFQKGCSSRRVPGWAVQPSNNELSDTKINTVRNQVAR